MKKTLVAVAAMAAVTGAMADITLTGNFDQALVNSKNGDTVKTSAFSSSGMGAGTLGDTFITFAGSENISGGLKASFKLEPRLNPNAATYSMVNREAYLGLAGSFGDIKIGANYTPIFNQVAAGSDVGGVSNAIGWLPATAGTVTIGGGTSTALYTLPSLVTGLNVQAMLKKGGADSVGNNVATTYTAAGLVNAAGQGQGDGNGFAASYTMAGLTAGYGIETTKNTRLAYSDNYLVAQQVTAASTTQSVKNTAMSLAYNAGFANLTYLNAKATLGTGGIKTNTYAISVPLGATTINYSMSSQSSNTGVAAAVDQKFSGSQLQAKYALSNRTSAYFQQGAMTNKTAGVVANTKSNSTGLGITHSF